MTPVRCRRLLAVLALGCAAALAACGEAGPPPGDAAAPAASRLETIQARGHLVCAGRNDTPGYGFVDDTGRISGFDVDLCRAVAAAVFGDPDKLELRHVNATEMGVTMQSGEVDMMARAITRTTSREAQWGNFVITMLYDGQGFLVPASLGVASARELSGAAVCVASGTTTELNLADFFRQSGMAYNPVVFEDSSVLLDAYKEGQCDVYTHDRTQLYVLRQQLDDPNAHVILPETISEEPLTPIVPHGDEQWFDVVKTVMAGLIYAEAYGVHSGNVDAMAAGDNVKVKRLLGAEGSFGQETLGLADTFMRGVITSVGNYGEIFDRNLGAQGFGLPRAGRNDLWTNGGQLYAPPLR